MPGSKSEQGQFDTPSRKTNKITSTIYQKPDEFSVALYYQADELSVALYYQADELSVPLFYEQDELSIALYFEQDELSLVLYYHENTIISLFNLEWFGWNTVCPGTNTNVSIQYARNMCVLNDRNVVVPLTKLELNLASEYPDGEDLLFYDPGVWFTAAGHTKTDDDIESVYTDVNGRYWILKKINGNYIALARGYGHDTTPSSPGTLTYATGGSDHSNISYTSTDEFTNSDASIRNLLFLSTIGFTYYDNSQDIVIDRFKINFSAYNIFSNYSGSGGWAYMDVPLYAQAKTMQTMQNDSPIVNKLYAGAGPFIIPVLYDPTLTPRSTTIKSGIQITAKNTIDTLSSTSGNVYSNSTLATYFSGSFANKKDDMVWKYEYFNDGSMIQGMGLENVNIPVNAYLLIEQADIRDGLPYRRLFCFAGTGVYRDIWLKKNSTDAIRVGANIIGIMLITNISAWTDPGITDNQEDYIARDIMDYLKYHSSLDVCFSGTTGATYKVYNNSNEIYNNFDVNSILASAPSEELWEDRSEQEYAYISGNVGVSVSVYSGHAKMLKYIYKQCDPATMPSTGFQNQIGYASNIVGSIGGCYYRKYWIDEYKLVVRYGTGCALGFDWKVGDNNSSTPETQAVYNGWTDPSYISGSTDPIQVYQFSDPIQSDGTYAKVFDPMFYVYQQGYNSAFGKGYAFKCGNSQTLDFDAITLATGFSQLTDDSVSPSIEYTSTGYQFLLQNKYRGAFNQFVVVGGGGNGKYWLPKVSVVSTLSDRYALTVVQYSLNTAGNVIMQYYFGILDVTTKRHYSPMNIAHSEVLYHSFPIITDISILTSADMRIDLYVATNKFDTYMSLRNIKNDSKNIYAGYYDSDCYLQSYSIDNFNLLSELRIINENIPLDFTGAMNGKHYTVKSAIVETDYIIAKYINTFRERKLGDSDISTLFTSSLLGNTVPVIIGDINFVCGYTSLPVLYPAFGYGISTTQYSQYDSTEYETSPSSITESQIYKNCYNFMFNKSITNYTDPLPGTITIINYPSVNYDSYIFASPPEKLTEFFGIYDVRNLNKIGSKTFESDNKYFTSIDNNLYSSSRIRTIRSGDIKLTSKPGEFYFSGNFLVTASTNSTYIYTIDKFSQMNLLSVIDSKILTDPLIIGENMVMVCTKGIYTLRNNMIYQFEYEADSAQVKVCDGNAYIIGINTSSSFTSFIGLASAEKFLYLDVAGTRYALSVLQPRNYFYRINKDLQISQVIHTNLTSYETTGSYIYDKSDVDTGSIRLYNPYKVTYEGKISNSLYSVQYSLDYPNRYDGDSAYGLLKTSPATKRNEAGDIFWITDCILSVITTGGGGYIIFKIYNGSTVLYSKTISVIGLGHGEIKFDDIGLEYKMIYTTIQVEVNGDAPDNIVTITNIKFNGSWMPDQTYNT